MFVSISGSMTETESLLMKKMALLRQRRERLKQRKEEEAAEKPKVAKKVQLTQAETIAAAKKILAAEAEKREQAKSKSKESGFKRSCNINKNRSKKPIKARPLSLDDSPEREVPNASSVPFNYNNQRRRGGNRNDNNRGGGTGGRQDRQDRQNSSENSNTEDQSKPKKPHNGLGYDKQKFTYVDPDNVAPPAASPSISATKYSNFVSKSTDQEEGELPSPHNSQKKRGLVSYDTMSIDNF